VSSPIKHWLPPHYFGISITLTNPNLTYRYLKRDNQRLEAMSLTNRTRSYKSLIDWLIQCCFYVSLKNISLSSHSRIFNFHDWLIIYSFTSRSRNFHGWLFAVLRPAQEYFTYMETLWRRHHCWLGNVSTLTNNNRTKEARGKVSEVTSLTNRNRYHKW
jgi:hypothetical protein